jgi:Protein of unknown function (DUF1175)
MTTFQYFPRLDAPSDQNIFRCWFVLIAKFQTIGPANEAPREINDSASLRRCSCRNPLRTHDVGWFSETQIAPPSVLPSLEKYRYPGTPLYIAVTAACAAVFAPSIARSTAARNSSFLPGFIPLSSPAGPTNSSKANARVFEHFRMSGDCNADRARSQPPLFEKCSPCSLRQLIAKRHFAFARLPGQRAHGTVKETWLQAASLHPKHSRRVWHGCFGQMGLAS